jgi:predicted permease
MRLLHDVAWASRSLRSERAISAVIVLTLTLGIAANAIMVGVVDQLLIQWPPGIAHGDELRRLYFGSQASGASRPQPNQSYPAITAIRNGVGAFAGASALHRATVTVGRGVDAKPAAVELVNADYFSLLRLAPAAGRFFTVAEDRVPDADPVLVLGHAFWKREFGGDPAAVGRDLLIEGQRLTVVGVAPRGFTGTRRQQVDAWLPPGAIGRVLFGDDWSSTDNFFRFELIARLATGATDAQANALATAIYQRAIGSAASEGAIAFGAPLNGLGNPNGVTNVGKVGLWLLGVAAAVLLIACANVANLQLARTIARGREIGVRVALGASRGQLLRQLLTESALLSAIAVAVALGVTYAVARVVQEVLLPGFVWNEGVVDERVLAITLVLSMVTTFAAGLAPAVHALSDDVMDRIRPAQCQTRGRAGALRTGLLVMQVALSLVLLVGAGLFVRSLAAVRSFDVGVDLDRVIQASLPPTLPAEQSEALYRAATERLSGMPGVQSVALGGGSTRLKTSRSRTMVLEGMTRAEREAREMDAYFVISPGYFATLGAGLERGRDFTVEDERSRARVAVINRALADRFWPAGSAVGQCVSFRITFRRSACTTIVGVVENTVLHNRVSVESAQVFVLRAHPEFADERTSALLIRTAGPAAPLVPSVRQALQSLAPDLGYVEAATLEAMLAPQLQPWRLGSSMFAAFGGVALLMALVGLYSAMVFAVSQRRHEIGIRMALGASGWDIAKQVSAPAVARVAVGLTLGLLGATVATQWLEDLLFQTSPRDPVVFAGVTVALGLAGIVAWIVPARRATRVDPLIVLKAD